jgi:hypothetical protein
MHRREVRLAFSMFLGLGLAGTVVGCEEEFSDEPFGTLDLAPVYDGGTSANPAAGIPQEIGVSPGYLGGSEAEYYDFGVVPTIINPEDGSPIAVRVQPMYFFFDRATRPLFASPVREVRNGTDWIKGGMDVLNPNPKNFCPPGAAAEDPCQARNAEEKKKSYPARQRDPLLDSERGVDDYQRPLIDLTPQDNSPPRRQYTGLWEIVEVTVPDGYKVDSIKSVATLDQAIAAGKFSKRATGKVINCPLIDERTYVLRGVTSRRTFHPRIELWYRRQLATCFLANGWPTLGRDDGVRWFANQDDLRLDTFDVARITVGAGAAAGQELVVPVGRAYVPAVTPDVEDAVTSRPPGNIVTATQPRRRAEDPMGYSPMRWMFDVTAPSDFVPGNWTSMADIDTGRARPQPGSFVRPLVRNLPLRGVRLKCSFKEDFSTTDDFNRPKKQCGNPVPTPTGTKFDPKGDPVCNMERDPLNPDDVPLECNKDTCFCDAPVVGYGQACGSGIAQCSEEEDKFAPNGYVCFPPWGGFCQRNCQGGNSMAQQNIGKEPTQWVDSRCFGVKGFICLGGLGCIKFCDQNVTDPKQCAVNVMVGMEMKDIQEGQTCQDFGLQVCTWPDTWEPKPFTVPQ